MEVGGAQGVAGSAAPSAKAWTRARRACGSPWSGRTSADRLPYAGSDRLRAARRQWSAARPGAGIQRFEHGVEQRPQGVGAFGA